MAAAGLWIYPAEAATTPQTVTLGWNANSETGLAGYRVYVGGASRQYTQTFEAGLGINYSVAGLVSGKTYYFAVAAVGGTGLESPLSTELVFTTATPAPVVTLHTLALGWDAVPDSSVATYRVQVGTQSQVYATTYDAGSALQYPISGLEYGKTYYFVVSAIGNTGLESLVSNELAVTIATPPLPVGNRIVSVGPGQSGLQWTFPRSALTSSPKFIVQQSPDLITWTTAATVLASQVSGGDVQSAQFSWPIQATGNHMFYRLTASNWIGSSTGP